MIRKLDRVRLTRDERVELSDLLQEVADIPRPKTRAECVNGPRPCPWVSCRYHLYLDVDPETGAIKLNTNAEPWEMAESCVLDVAERGSQTCSSDGATLEEVGELLSVTRERIRQIEAKAMRHMRLAVARKGLSRELHGSIEGDKHRPDLNDASQSVENIVGAFGDRFTQKVAAWQPENRKKLSHWTRSKKKGKASNEPTTRSGNGVSLAGVQGETMEDHEHQDLTPALSRALAPVAIADSKSLVRSSGELQQDSATGANGAEPEHPAPAAPRPERRRAARTAHRSNDRGRQAIADIPRNPVVTTIAQEAYTQIIKGDTMTDAPNTALQAHIKALRRAGWTRSAIATSAGIGTATLGRAMRGQATENTCAALLGIEVRKIAKTPKPKAPPKKHPVSAAVLEHTQKLRALGWTWDAIAKQLGYSETGIINIASGHRPMKPETEAALLALPLEAPETPQKSRRSQKPATAPEPVTVPKPLKISCASCNDKEGVVCDEPLCVRFRAKPAPKLEPQYLTIPPATAQAAKEILAIPRTPLEHIDAKILETEMRLRILRELRAELQ